MHWNLELLFIAILCKVMTLDSGQFETDASRVGGHANGNDDESITLSGGMTNNGNTFAASSSPSSPPHRASRRVAVADTATVLSSTSPVPDNDNAPSPDPPLAAPPRSLSSSSGVVQQTDANAIATSNSNSSDAILPAPAAVPKARIVVARPPLNAYLKIAIIRDGTTDAVVCEDPEHPGTKKRIIMTTQLSASLEACSTNEDDVVNNKTKDEKEPSQRHKNNSNKKEIPVPTITTVKRYDRDVPPNFDIPQSYSRHICPTYEQVMEEAVEYNIDAEDEYWWRENMQFGPFAKPKIIMGEREEGNETTYKTDPSSSQTIGPDNFHRTNVDGNGMVKDNVNEKGVSDDATKVEEGTAFISKSTTTEKYGRKKMRKSSIKSSKSSSSLSSSNLFLDDNIPDNSMQIDQTNSDAPLPPPAPSSTIPQPHHHHDQSMTIEQVLLLNPKYLYSQHSTRSLLQKYNPKLPLPIFEKIMDTLEKATGFESIMTISQAEQLLVMKVPQLVDIFGPLSAMERQREEEMEEQYVSRWLKNKHITTIAEPDSSSSSSLAQPRPPLPTLAPPVTLPTVIHQVYNYWVAKRSKLKKPLLRRYWPATSASDPNPHQVFRQRDKEKRRLRKKRQNDTEAYKKMKQLKLDFERVGVLCELILKREEVNRNLVELTNEYFKERWYSWTDTTGVPRRLQQNINNSGNLMNRGKMLMMMENGVLQNVPKYFDDGPILRLRGSKKRQRPAAQNTLGGGWNAEVRELSPIPPNFAVSTGVLLPPFPSTNNPAMLSSSSASMTLVSPQGIKPNPLLPGGGFVVPVPPPPPPPKNIVVAGHDGGYPAPNFLQPLASRDSHPIPNWDDAVPSIPSYVNGHLITQTDRFRHRPRLGRGGRIIIDRIPIPTCNYSNEGPCQGNSISTSPAAPTVVTYGSPMKRSGYDIGTLGADGPNYSVTANPNDNNLYDAKSAPKAPPAKCLADLLPKSLGDTIVLSRRIEEICALGLMEDYQNQLGNRIDGGSTATTAGVAASVSVTSASNNGNSAASAILSEEMDEILVPIEDWMEAPEALNLFGSEQFVIGPL